MASVNSIMGSILDVTTFPAQTVSDKIKQSSAWQQACMNYFDYQTTYFNQTKIKDLKKYKLLGNYTVNDYSYITNPLAYIQEEKDEYGNTEEIKHYPIAAQAINTFIGEYLRRPLNYYCISLSPRARNEYIRIKTEMLQQYVMQKVQQRVANELIQEGIEVENPEFEQQLQARMPEEIQEYMNKDYVDIAEQLGSRIAKNMWMREDLDLTFMTGMKHACITAKEFYHIYSVGNKVKIKALSPLRVFFQNSLDSDWVSESQYAGVELHLTLSSIIDIYGNSLTIQDVKNLEKLIYPGAASIKGPSMEWRTDVFQNAQGNTHANVYHGQIDEMLTEYYNTGSTGLYSTTSGLIRVIQAYWRSKKEIAELMYVDEEGELQTMTVDRNYKFNEEDFENVTWKTIDQIYQGTKIGNDIYVDIRPYVHQYYDPEDSEIAPLPIEGCIYNAMHMEPTSMIDLMTPWIELYNIVAYELKKDMRKAIGKVMFMSYDNLPKIKGFTKEKWLYWVREFGIAWVSNNKRDQGQFSHYSAQDMSFAEQMAAKMQILDQIKANCDSYAGFTQPRLGSMGTNQTLGQDRQSVNASVNQTEYWFFKHTKLVGKVLNQAVNLEKRIMRNSGSLRNLLDDLEIAYLDYSGLDLDNEKLYIYVTNSNDAHIQKETLRQMALQAVVNGSSDMTDMSDVIMATTISEIRGTLEKLRDMRRQQEEAQRQAEQQAIEAQKEIAAAELETTLTIARERNMSNERQAYIRSFARQPDNMVDSNGDNVPDIVQNADAFYKIQTSSSKALSDLRKSKLEETKLKLEEKFKNKEFKLKEKEIQRDYDNMKNDLEIARENRKGRNKGE